ncbi:MAG: IPT/TIG domain-containing protein [Kiritimatiellaeota bacterium]|nr:IPT/TIG domain-containing protein [Kiritimatiellota bacterium]
MSANWDAVDGATNYLLDVSLNSGFTNFVSGYSNLSVGSVATWRVTGLFSGTNYYYRLREQQAGLTSDNSTSITVSTPMPAVSANSGPSVGGNLITISGTGIGNGSDITNVTICGVAAVIQSQTADSVTVMVPTGGQGTGDIIIRSGSQGTTTIKNVYTYHPPGYIFGAFQGWSSISNLPAVRANMGAAAVNGKIYAIGGQQNNNTYVSTAYVFDPAQPTSGWTNITNLPGNRSYVAAVAVKGKLYALGGRSANNTYVNTAYVFDPLQPGLGWTSLSNLPVTRAAMGATCLNDKIYALGGYNGSYQTNAYVYDPAQSTASWSSVSSLPATRGYLAATAVNGKLYAIGGYNGSYQNTVYAYNPLLPSNGWSGVSNLPALNGYLAAASVNGSLLALGGYNSSSSYLSTVNTLDPQQTLTGWTNLSTLPATRRGLAVAQLNGDLYAIGGYNGSYWNTAYKGTYASGVTPASASRLGGTTITLTGAYLGNGDVTNVTLCGVAASILADNSPTQIVISTAASAVPTNGDVVVYSTRYGVTTRSNAFTYADALATISVQASPTNAGSVTGGGTFGVGLADMLIATASNNWLFTLWNDGVTDNPRSVTVPPTNITYTANFIKIDSVGDGIPDWWRAQYFGGTGTSTDAVSCATSDPDNDGVNNLQEYLADTDPTNATSHLALIGLAVVTNDVFITWVGGSNAWQAIECSGDLTDTNAWSDLFINAPPTPITNTWPHLGAGTATNLFYRIKAWR